MVGVIAELGLELGKAAAAAEIHLINAAQTVEIQKLVVDGYGLII